MYVHVYRPHFAVGLYNDYWRMWQDTYFAGEGNYLTYDINKKYETADLENKRENNARGVGQIQ